MKERALLDSLDKTRTVNVTTTEDDEQCRGEGDAQATTTLSIVDEARQTTLEFLKDILGNTSELVEDETLSSSSQDNNDSGLESFDDEVVHDQLPSVEEANSTIPHKAEQNHNQWRNRLWVCIVVSAITAIFAICFVLLKGNSKRNDQENEFDDYDKVAFFFFDKGVSDLPALSSPRTPQNRAAAFIAEEGSFSNQLTDDEAQRLIERYVLIVIFYHFHGESWNYNLKFLTDSDHCDWWETFESASGRELRMGVACDDNGFVTTLDLAWNGLTATHIPDEIGFLNQLQHLYMYNNPMIGGSFPEAFRQLSNLQGIALMRSGLEGTIPNWIGELTQLTMLALGSNKFKGTIPSSVSKLNKLRLVGLDDNKLMGDIGVFKQMINLEALFLEDNRLSGNLDSTEHWKNLVELDVSNNMITGSIPASFFKLPKLAVMDIHGNFLSHEFPTDMVQNDVLEYLSMHSNAIIGQVSDRLGFLKNLYYLDISFNRMTGTLPDTLTMLTNLRYLSTSGNRFDVQEMMDLSPLTNLRDLSMKSNNLQGPIPDWIGTMFNLQFLDLDSNRLTGTVPSWIGLLQKLDHLLLSRNQLTGTLPSQMEHLVDLKSLLLEGNSFHGNADVICRQDSMVDPVQFVSDCYPGENGQAPEIECRCCTMCCNDDDVDCNNNNSNDNNNQQQSTGNADSVWEYGYVRPLYRYNIDNAPASYSKGGGDNHQDPSVAATVRLLP